MLWMMGVNRCHVGRLTSEKKEKTENVLHSKIDYDCCVCVCGCYGGVYDLVQVEPK
jgi:hypothetical protein